jgi:hypothetical protein
MSSDHFVKVFDVLDSGFKDWYFPAFGLIFVLVGVLGFAFSSERRGPFHYGIPGFAILWTIATFSMTYASYARHKELVQENRCSVVEGPVEQFVPMPSGGHAQESFSVSGVRFDYSDFGPTDAFNNAASYDGPIKSDSYVRICYDPSENAILRLEIRDFKGRLKDYGSLFNNFK